jgi:hypothetical protein
VGFPFIDYWKVVLLSFSINDQSIISSKIIPCAKFKSKDEKGQFGVGEGRLSYGISFLARNHQVS